MTEMGDHFWPSVYPGLALGILYGLSLGGLRSLISCTLGALGAAFLAFNLGASFLAEEGLLPVITMLAVSFMAVWHSGTVARSLAALCHKVCHNLPQRSA